MIGCVNLNVTYVPRIYVLSLLFIGESCQSQGQTTLFCMSVILWVNAFSSLLCIKHGKGR